MAETHKPPLEVAKEAEKGLELREKFGRGGTQVGVARARDLKARKDLSDDTIKRMVSYFARHTVTSAAKLGRCRSSVGRLHRLAFVGRRTRPQMGGGAEKAR